MTMLLPWLPFVKQEISYPPVIRWKIVCVLFSRVPFLSPSHGVAKREERGARGWISEMAVSYPIKRSVIRSALCSQLSGRLGGELKSRIAAMLYVR
jgi:hypothetical protein